MSLPSYKPFVTDPPVDVHRLDQEILDRCRSGDPAAERGMASQLMSVGRGRITVVVSPMVASVILKFPWIHSNSSGFHSTLVPVGILAGIQVYADQRIPDDVAVFANVPEDALAVLRTEKVRTLLSSVPAALVDRSWD